MNWDDLQYYLAMRSERTLSGAARVLGVTHATVGRRISALEESLSGKLFEKAPGGEWMPTPLADAVAEAAEQVSEAVSAFERVVQGVDASPRGRVRIATSQFIQTQFLAPAAIGLREQHPDILLEVMEAPKLASLPRLEADLGLRFLRRGLSVGADSVHITRLGSFAWELYGHPDLVERHGIDVNAVSLAGVPVVQYNEGAPYVPGSAHLRKLAGDTPLNLSFTSSTMYGVATAVAAGIGVGVIPRQFAGPNLVVLSGELLRMDLWLAVHEDMRNSARVRVVTDFLKAWARDNPQLFDAEDESAKLVV